ncbi:iojap family protein [Listeria floridensis FSL S10-1187]|uniref:Ribosomal silencing factor RsfS n=1 Tax=Listeria floridensis FSL S10-1187 TaxID=1265817 RepID=A0ABN0RGA6_9LIST|nr:ribosome silencing factor [Listeria floridensis]EUJ32818.1 iojap family protein [Listeria floridensis FSL S10-1187]
MNSHDVLMLVARAADDKRAEDILALNMQGLSGIADYFVICHGNSDKQVQAIAREIKEKAQENDVEVKRLEGFDAAQWVLIDLGDVIVHVFHRDERSYYNLEKLWGDAPLENVSEAFIS